MRQSVLSAFILLALAPVCARAQTAPQPQPDLQAPAATTTTTTTPDQPEKNVLEGNYLTLGGGLVYGPAYEGSKHYVPFPIPAIQGRIAGVSINPRAGGAALDVIADPKGAKIGWSLGPVVTYSGNRDNHVVDPVVRSAGRLDYDLAVGGSGGATLYRVLDHYDSITASVDVKWDIHGAHGGMQISPSLTYLTPLSKALVATVTVSAKHVNNSYANYYYSVDSQQNLDSGLPLYTAHGGWASVGSTLILGYSLGGDLRRGGFTLVAIGGYSKLLNDAALNPYTALRGSPNQWVGGGGIAYTF